APVTRRSRSRLSLLRPVRSELAWERRWDRFVRTRNRPARWTWSQAALCRHDERYSSRTAHVRRPWKAFERPGGALRGLGDDEMGFRRSNTPDRSQGK